MQRSKPRQLNRLEVKPSTSAFNGFVSRLFGKSKVSDMRGVYTTRQSLIHFVKKRGGFPRSGRTVNAKYLVVHFLPAFCKFLL